MKNLINAFLNKFEKAFHSMSVWYLSFTEFYPLYILAVYMCMCAKYVYNILMITSLILSI